ncbi:sulfite reductase [Chitinophaga alhagiae]|uniref:Sulfite reductase n=1 Tax=Chitinophaga alhagiae TaxID=2203219 RepID=A0ABM6WD67_9BACT|nr:PepSY-associated TM helix domain-containing protein [Chitinophaga alhagiae]AWO01944.1 sulfite reductase [Chitinophaga alhagiae]
MASVQKNPAWRKIRKIFNDIHLWMGIASGLILFVVCLSGTIYTFSTEIQEMLEPAKYKVQAPAGAERLGAETLMARVRDSLGKVTVNSITIPAAPGRVYQVNVKKVEKTEGQPPQGGRGDRGTTYLVDPYTAEIRGTPKGAGSDFFMVMFRLHRWLLLDTEIGRPIVGWATVVFALLVMTGLVIWFPQHLKAWKQGLRIRFSGNWKRINHDLHNTLGFYSSILLLIMALTGLTWSFSWYRTGLNKMLGVHKPEGAAKERPLQSAPPADSAAAPLSIAELLATADRELPYKGEYRILLPGKPTATVQLSKARTGFFAPAAGDRLQLDQYSGAVLQKEIFRDKPLNERIAASFKALHVGNVYGTFSKILYFIACLFATSLPVTGTLIWINKLRKKPAGKKKPAAVMAEAQ